MENREQAVLGSPAVLHELDAGFPVKPALGGPEDIVMK